SDEISPYDGLVQMLQGIKGDEPAASNSSEPDAAPASSSSTKKRESKVPKLEPFGMMLRSRKQVISIVPKVQNPRSSSDEDLPGSDSTASEDSDDPDYDPNDR